MYDEAFDARVRTKYRKNIERDYRPFSIQGASRGVTWLIIFGILFVFCPLGWALLHFAWGKHKELVAKKAELLAKIDGMTAVTAYLLRADTRLYEPGSEPHGVVGIYSIDPVASQKGWDFYRALAMRLNSASADSEDPVERDLAVRFVGRLYNGIQRQLLPLEVTQGVPVYIGGIFVDPSELSGGALIEGIPFLPSILYSDEKNTYMMAAPHTVL